MDAPREAKVDKFALNKYSTELRKEFSFVAELNSMAVQSAAERGWFAISCFYDNCKSKKQGKKGFPKFQKNCRSVEYKTSGWKLHPTKRRIKFTDKNGIGELKLLGKWDIQVYDVKDIKRVRLIRRAVSEACAKRVGYYVQFCIGIDLVDIQPKTGAEIGLDVGINSFYTDSNGHHEPNPKFLRKAEKAIKHSQRQIYKKQKASQGRRKARARFSRKHLRISRQRNEHAKRIARNVCKSNANLATGEYPRGKVCDLVAYENLPKLSGSVKAPEEQARSAVFRDERPGMKRDAAGFNLLYLLSQALDYRSTLQLKQ